MLKWIIIVAVIVISSYLISRAAIISHKDKKDAEAQLDAESPEPAAVPARVMEKEAGGSHTGGKVSRYVPHYMVKFLTDEGAELVYDVPAEKFAEISEGDTGMLVTVGEKFIDFGEGDEIN